MIENIINDIEDDDQQLFEHWKVQVDEGQTPVRIDKYLAEKNPYQSRNRIQNAADAGFIQVNGTPVKSNYKVRPNDVITLMLDYPKHDTSIVAENIPIDVVYEDDDLMVINKAAGMVVHPGAGNFTGTLINAIAYYLRDLESFDANNPEVGLVHRIDKDTSGLLVVAKTPEAKSALGKQFFNKTTHRSYNALVWGNIVEDEGRIEGNIGRDPKNRLRMKVFEPDSGIGKSAVTHYRVLERFGYTTLIEDIRCLLMRRMVEMKSYEVSVVVHIKLIFKIALKFVLDRLCMLRHSALFILVQGSSWISRQNGLLTSLLLLKNGVILLVVLR